MYDIFETLSGSLDNQEYLSYFISNSLRCATNAIIQVMKVKNTCKNKYFLLFCCLEFLSIVLNYSVMTKYSCNKSSNHQKRNSGHMGISAFTGTGHLISPGDFSILSTCSSFFKITFVG